MGSPLGPALTNCFVGFHESRLFDNTAKPGVYIRYVDDSFVIFVPELDCDHFQEKLNGHYLTSHALTIVGRKMLSVYQKSVSFCRKFCSTNRLFKLCPFNFITSTFFSSFSGVFISILAILSI